MCEEVEDKKKKCTRQIFGSRGGRGMGVEQRREKKKKICEAEQEAVRDGKVRGAVPPSRRTKDGANNGDAFSGAAVAGRSIFSPASMRPGERERGGERERNRGEERQKGREERRDEC